MSKSLTKYNNGIIVPQEDEADTLGPVEREDLKQPWWSCNVKTKDSRGKWHPPNVWQNTITREVRSELEGFFLARTKSRQRSTYDEKANLTTTHCRSSDCVTGTDENGQQLECARCEHERWKGPIPPKCNKFSVMAFADDKFNVAAIRFKGTALAPLRKFIQEKILYQIENPEGKNTDYRLYAYKVRLSLIQPKGTYAVPQIEVIAPATEEEYGICRELANDIANFAGENYQPPEDGVTNVKKVFGVNDIKDDIPF
jgi:hypothetical protein